MHVHARYRCAVQSLPPVLTFRRGVGEQEDGKRAEQRNFAVYAPTGHRHSYANARARAFRVSSSERSYPLRVHTAAAAAPEARSNAPQCIAFPPRVVCVPVSLHFFSSLGFLCPRARFRSADYMERCRGRNAIALGVMVLAIGFYASAREQPKRFCGARRSGGRESGKLRHGAFQRRMRGLHLWLEAEWKI